MVLIVHGLEHPPVWCRLVRLRVNAACPLPSTRLTATAGDQRLGLACRVVDADETPVRVVEARWERMRREERDEQLAQIDRETEQADRLAAALAPRSE